MDDTVLISICADDVDGPVIFAILNEDYEWPDRQAAVPCPKDILEDVLMLASHWTNWGDTSVIEAIEALENAVEAINEIFASGSCENGEFNITNLNHEKTVH